MTVSREQLIEIATKVCASNGHNHPLQSCKICQQVEKPEQERKRTAR